MKKIGELYTCRGMVKDNTVGKITLFDGRFDTGYRIVAFRIAGNVPSSATSDAYATLATEEGAATADWDWREHAQIGWTGSQVSTFGGAFAPDEVVDPDNMVIEDLYIYGNVGAGSTHVNYMITMQKYDISEWQGALAMVRNRSQA